MIKPRHALQAALCAVAALCWASPAAAHAPIAGIGALWNGALHPFLTPLHLLALLTIGLLLGQHAPRLSRVGWPVFAVAFAVAAALAEGAPVSPSAVLVVTALAALMVALQRTHLAVLLAVALASAIAIGLDSAPDALEGRQAVLFRLGTVFGGIVAITLAGGLAAALTRPWQKIAVRAAGSWIAAIAVLVLSLRLSAPELFQ